MNEIAWDTWTVIDSLIMFYAWCYTIHFSIDEYKHDVIVRHERLLLVLPYSRYVKERIYEKNDFFESNTWDNPLKSIQPLQYKVGTEINRLYSEKTQAERVPN